MNKVRCVIIVGVAACLLSLVAATGSMGAASQVAAATQPASQPRGPQRWESAIAAFEAYDRKNTPPKDAVLFVGSSSIVNWPTAASFKDWTVLNRGFGGSTFAELNAFVARIVTPYRPRAIIVYSGDNDAAAGKSAREIADDFTEFTRLVRKDLPDTPIFVLSIKPSPSRWKLWPTMKEANALIEGTCKTGRRLHYVDVAAPLLGTGGEPRAEFYLEDKLHLSPAGYEIWTSRVAAVVGDGIKR
ncbi:MAG: hypothetical protein IT450_20915 [Phycisphaerales bacterium]|nr:hypothetical protein [Phycisphaerales bacterium]